MPSTRSEPRASAGRRATSWRRRPGSPRSTIRRCAPSTSTTARGMPGLAVLSDPAARRHPGLDHPGRSRAGWIDRGRARRGTGSASRRGSLRHDHRRGPLTSAHPSGGDDPGDPRRAVTRQGRDAELDLAIIGGGAAGTSVAWAVQQARPEWSIALFERTSRIGGRLHSVRVDGLDHPIELGGMRYITSHRRVAAVIDQFALPTHPFDRPAVLNARSSAAWSPTAPMTPRPVAATT